MDHAVVLEIGTDTRQFDLDRDAQRLQHIARANTRDLKQSWREDGSSC